MEYDNNGFIKMSLNNLKLICLKDNGYESPPLNDSLYLNFKGFTKIENPISQYSNLKVSSHDIMLSNPE